MPNLPEKVCCCACAACVDSCKREAISLREDLNGFTYPVIDVDKCVECKACEKVCPILEKKIFPMNQARNAKPFSAWSKKDNIILRSASGGVFGQIAEDFLQKENSYVYGAELSEDNSVKMIEISSCSELYKIQNSKYHQSDATGVYKLIAKRLKDGNRCLFGGLPCQVAALYSFLKNNKALYQNLYTTEIVCHGTPTNELARLGLKIHKARGIYSYRNKVNGWGAAGNRLTYTLKDGTIWLCTDRRTDFVFRSYLTSNFFRENCYACKFANTDRNADVVLCDFWGNNKAEPVEKYSNYKGVSVAVAYSPKGEVLLRSENLEKSPVSWQMFLPYNQQFFSPSSKQLYRGGRMVHYIKRLPVFMQRIVYQNGFTNRVIDKIFNKFMRHFTRNIDKKKLTEMQDRLLTTLKYLGV